MPTNQGRTGAVAIPAVAAAMLYSRPKGQPIPRWTPWIESRKAAALIVGDSGEPESPAPTSTAQEASNT